MKSVITIIILFSYFSSFSQDTAYWNHIYNPSRLVMVHENAHASGLVTKVIKERDGDYHIWIKMIGKREPLNVEIICAFPNKKVCEGYVNKIIKPRKGNYIILTGDYVYDKKHKWYEIHPVKSIEIVY